MKLSDLDRARVVGEELELWIAFRDYVKAGYRTYLSFDANVTFGKVPIDKDQASIIAEKYIAAARIKLSEMGVEE